MRAFGLVVTAVVSGSVLGWWLLAGLCSIPWLKFSNACGHNAVYWLPLFIPVAIAVCWFVLAGAVSTLRRRAVKERVGRGGA